MDIVFDQKFPVVGEELPVTLGFENVIFVMEDVDAASPIVHCRDKVKRKRGTKTTVEVMQQRVRYISCKDRVFPRTVLALLQDRTRARRFRHMVGRSPLLFMTSFFSR